MGRRQLPHGPRKFRASGYKTRVELRPIQKLSHTRRGLSLEAIKPKVTRNDRMQAQQKMGAGAWDGRTVSKKIDLLQDLDQRPFG